MKKFVSILAALMLAAGCFSCSEDKKPNSDSKPADDDVIVSESDGAVDKPVVQQQAEFREFKADDFKTINVVINKTDKEPPFKLHSINVTDIDFGERLSPCKSEEYRDRYKPDFGQEMEYKYLGDEEKNGEIQALEEEWEQLCKEPVKGDIVTGCYRGNDIYVAVTYDPRCKSGSAICYHELSIFHVDGLTGKTEELYRHSDPESAFGIDQLYWYHDRLYIDAREYGLMYLDNGELVPMNYLPEYSNWFYPNSADRLIVKSTKSDLKEVPEDYEPKSGEIVQEDTDGKKFLYLGSDDVMSEYFPETGEWKELYHEYCNIDQNTGESVDGVPLIYGDLFAVAEKPEGKRKYDVVTDEYRISTGLTACNILYAGHDRLVVDYGGGTVVPGGNHDGDVVHIFDISKMEHYVFDCSSLGMNCQYFNGGLFVYPSGNSGTLYYVMPELGLTFPYYKLEGKSDVTDFTQRIFSVYNEENSFSFEEGVVVDKKEHNNGENTYYTDYKYSVTRFWINGDEMNG